MELGQLLHPHTLERFLREVWEKEPLHVGRDENPALEGYFDELVTLGDLDRLLTTTFADGPRPAEAVRMGRDGIMVPPSEYLSRREGAFAQVDVERVLMLHRGGASIILNSVHTALEPVGELCAAISQLMGVRVHANVYITPREAQGFPLHFDPHDVFLLQFAGEKRWELWPSTVPLAQTEPRGPDDLTPSGAGTSVHLRRGELLYIPRGLLHVGVTSEEMSAHLTIGMNPFTWSQLLHDLVVELEQEDVDFRRSVAPPGALQDVSRQFDEMLEHLTARLNDPDRASRLADRSVADLRARARSPLRGLLQQIHDAGSVGLETTVRLRQGSRPDIRHDDAAVVLTIDGCRLTLPAFTRPHLEALCAGEPIRAVDLPSTMDDGSKLVLLRRLVREGLLVPVDAPG